MLPYGIFGGCISLVKIELPAGIHTIGEEAFYGCTALARITLPEGITTVEKNAFYDCKRLYAIDGVVPRMADIASGNEALEVLLF